jgi:Flp pilus assembly pilin Flp
MSRFRRNRKGVALLEVLIAGVILAVVLVGFMQGLNVTLLGTHRDSQINSVQHIAQSQMEYIKSLSFNASIESCSCTYQPPNYDDCSSCYGIDPEAPEDYKNYIIDIAVCSWCEEDCLPVPTPDPCDIPKQLITVTVSYNSTNLASQNYQVVLQDYKIDR